MNEKLTRVVALIAEANALLAEVADEEQKDAEACDAIVEESVEQTERLADALTRKAEE